MTNSKRRKIRHIASEGYNEGKDVSDPERKEDLRREDVFFPELSQVAVPASTPDTFLQNSNGNRDIFPPTVSYLHAFRSFVSLRTSNPTVRIRLNLPNLVIPPRLVEPEESVITELRVLLKDIGFDVVDRATLSFSAIGSELDLQKAAKCFVNFYKLSKTTEFKTPSREIL